MSHIFLTQLLRRFPQHLTLAPAQRLDLSGCGITDAHLPSLLQLSSLQQLDLSRNPLTAQLPAAVDDASQAGGAGDAGRAGEEREGPAALRQGGRQQGQGGGREQGRGEEQGQREGLGLGEEGGQALPWWAQPPAFPGLSHAEAQEQMEAVWRNPDIPQPSLGSRTGTNGRAAAVHASRGRDGSSSGGGGAAVIGSRARDGSGGGGVSDGGVSGGAALAGAVSAEGEGEAGACVGGRGCDPQGCTAWGGLPHLTSLLLRDTEVNASGEKGVLSLALGN